MFSSNEFAFNYLRNRKITESLNVWMLKKGSVWLQNTDWQSLKQHQTLEQ